jgi:hypothetical protein
MGKLNELQTKWLDEVAKWLDIKVKDVPPAPAILPTVAPKIAVSKKAPKEAPKKARTFPDVLGDQDVVTKGPTKGLTTKAREPEYKDEEKKVGSVRANATRPAESDALTTKYFNEDERKASRLTAKDGRLLAPGEVISPYGDNSRSIEYVIDPVTGDFHQFRANESVKVPAQEQGTGDGCSSPEAAPATSPRMVTKNTHHSSVLEGNPVAGAGQADLDDGKVKYINNRSGHYRPRASHLLQTLEVLARLGATLNTELVDKDGKPLTGHARLPELRKALEDHQTRIAKVRQKLEELITADGKVSGKSEEDEESRQRERQIDKLEKEVEELGIAMELGQQIVKDIGAGPRNKALDVEVDLYKSTTQSKTQNPGEFFRNGEKETSKAEGFMQSGGAHAPAVIDEDTARCEINKQLEQVGSVLKAKQALKNAKDPEQSILEKEALRLGKVARHIDSSNFEKVYADEKSQEVQRLTTLFMTKHRAAERNPAQKEIAAAYLKRLEKLQDGFKKKQLTLEQMVNLLKKQLAQFELECGKGLQHVPGSEGQQSRDAMDQEATERATKDKAARLQKIDKWLDAKKITAEQAEALRRQLEGEAPKSEDFDLAIDSLAKTAK